jgi:hypothetical protein
MLVNIVATVALVAATVQAKVTGCSCNGYSYTYVNKFNEKTTNVRDPS